MSMSKTMLAILVGCAVLTGAVSAADAKPHHRHKHVVRHHHAVAQPGGGTGGSPVVTFDRGGLGDGGTVLQYADGGTKASPSGKRAHTGDAFGGFSSNSLVSEARRYMGTNPTGRRSQWCGAFVDLVLKKTGHAPGSNLAAAYKNYGTRVSGPQVGAIAVMNHHVGIVSGIDANGNPILISGNHNRTTAESVYPRSRIAYYVVPN